MVLFITCRCCWFSNYENRFIWSKGEWNESIDACMKYHISITIFKENKTNVQKHTELINCSAKYTNTMSCPWLCSEVLQNIKHFQKFLEIVLLAIFLFHYSKSNFTNFQTNRKKMLEYVIVCQFS